MNEIKRSIVTLREMISDRGWDGSSFDTDPSLSIDDIASRMASSPVLSVDVPSCNLRVVWNTLTKFRTADIKKTLNDPPACVILIISDPLTAISSASLVDSKTLIEVFRLAELQVNISRHVKVPRHQAIREDAEISELLKQYSLKSRYQLPIIKSSDPMARYLALRPGQVVRITRISPSAGTYVLFRCCMKDG
jgi:DNA-directed RNA polymerase I, II, and III subunit RPABC1